MLTRTASRALMSSAAIVVGWSFLTALQCSDAPTSPYPVQHCQVSYDPGFPSSGSVTRTKPASCPILLPGAMDIPFGATAQFAQYSVNQHFLSYDVITWKGYHSSALISAAWNDPGTGTVFANITGDYWAATSYFDSYAQGSDTVLLGFSVPTSFDYQYARVAIAYKQGSASYNTVTAPSAVDPYTTYTVSAETNDPVLVNPVTWAWYVNGALKGTTSNPTTTVTAGPAGSSQKILVVVTDPNGRSVSGSKTVNVPNVTCGVGSPC